jgi:hypothetical protein
MGGRRRFGADQGIIGQHITLDDQTFSVVGVLGPLPPSLTPDVLVVSTPRGLNTA